jgi:hypothetical protein
MLTLEAAIAALGEHRAEHTRYGERYANHIIDESPEQIGADFAPRRPHRRSTAARGTDQTDSIMPAASMATNRLGQHHGRVESFLNRS